MNDTHTTTDTLDTQWATDARKGRGRPRRPGAPRVNRSYKLTELQIDALTRAGDGNAQRGLDRLIAAFAASGETGEP